MSTRKPKKTAIERLASARVRRCAGGPPKMGATFLTQGGAQEPQAEASIRLMSVHVEGDPEDVGRILAALFGPRR